MNKNQKKKLKMKLKKQGQKEAEAAGDGRFSSLIFYTAFNLLLWVGSSSLFLTFHFLVEGYRALGLMLATYR